jgi:hypothetical protein
MGRARDPTPEPGPEGRELGDHGGGARVSQWIRVVTRLGHRRTLDIGEATPGEVREVHSRWKTGRRHP